MALLVNALPCVVFEDEHLLVVNKPPGLNTHAPDPLGGEGIFEYFREREPRWAELAIIHRLDKDTSGLLVFTKTRLGNQSLTRQFTEREVVKEYVFLTDRLPRVKRWRSESTLTRAGERYLSRPGRAADLAITEFEPAPELQASGIDRRPVSAEGLMAFRARPLTGRTHQIRVHAADAGCPILGDALYGGTPAHRVCLHATALRFRHPATGQPCRFEAPPDFAAWPRDLLRKALIDGAHTDAYRLVHGASDGFPGFYLERLGSQLLAQSAQLPDAGELAEIERQARRCGSTGAAVRIRNRQVRRAAQSESSPRPLWGTSPSGPFTILENGLTYEMRFDEGYSTGLFLDQRDNRRRLLTGHIARSFELPNAGPDARVEILNTFAYTCGFSVAAAKAGARTTSLDLSRKYLDWGKRNFILNGIDPAGHDFVYGDTFDWLRRWQKKGRQFDVALLDPPTFSQSKQSGVFRAEKDYGRLVRAALGVLAKPGVVFASTNAEGWPPEGFIHTVEAAAGDGGWKILARHYAPQPPDHPVTRAEPTYLKTLWLRLG